MESYYQGTLIGSHIPLEPSEK